MPLPHFPGTVPVIPEGNWKQIRRKLKILNIFKIKKRELN